MRTFSPFLILLLLGISGCVAVTAPRYGNFTANPPAFDEKLAAETVEQLAALYPPAKTRLVLRQPTPDSFGKALIKGLREQGYALEEYDPEASGAKATSASGAEPLPNKTPAGLPLHYVLDKAPDTGLYHLAVTVGVQSIARLYRVENGTMTPAGYWVHRE